jgi:hypothetical protein
MSVLGCITMHECDHCKLVAVLTSDLQYQTFYDTWFTSPNLHYCPVCRHLTLPEIIEAVSKELAIQRAVRRAMKKYGTEAYNRAA